MLIFKEIVGKVSKLTLFLSEYETADNPTVVMLDSSFASNISDVIPGFDADLPLWNNYHKG